MISRGGLYGQEGSDRCEHRQVGAGSIGLRECLMAGGPQFARLMKPLDGLVRFI
jgi:hypothetical protein